MPKIIKILFFPFLTFLIFYLISQKIDFFLLKKIFLNIHLPYFFLACLITFLMPFLSAKKWQAVMRAIGYSFSFKNSFKIIMATLPFSVLAPAKSGDLIKAYYLKNKIPAKKTIGGIITERLIDLSVLASYSFIGAAILKNELILGISLVIIFLIILFFLMINKIKLPFLKWQKKLENFFETRKIFSQHPKKLLSILFYALIFWSIPIFLVKFLFLALGVNISFFYIAAAFPLAIFIGLIPITLAGMGTRDSAIIYFFSLFASPHICLGVGVLYSFLAYWLLALFGLPLMRKTLANVKPQTKNL